MDTKPDEQTILDLIATGITFKALLAQLGINKHEFRRIMADWCVKVGSENGFHNIKTFFRRQKVKELYASGYSRYAIGLMLNAGNGTISDDIAALFPEENDTGCTAITQEELTQFALDHPVGSSLYVIKERLADSKRIRWKIRTTVTASYKYFAATDSGVNPTWVDLVIINKRGRNAQDY